MAAQFFEAKDDKPTGVDNAYKAWTDFTRRNNLAVSFAQNPGSPPNRQDIVDAIGDIWDAIGGDIPTLRGHVVGAMNTDANDEEIAVFAYFVLREKFAQYQANIAPGGGP